MKRITVTIDEITENKMDIIIDAFGMSKSEFIRRAVDSFYFDQKKMWPGAIEKSIEKLKEE
jgi:metal-responsive CopG/Arc/MetJ family transcriptional regulator